MQRNGTLRTTVDRHNYGATIESCSSRQQGHSWQQIEQLYSVSTRSNPTPQALQQRVIPSQPEAFSNITGFVSAHRLSTVSGHQIQSTTACSNSPLIQWPENTQVKVGAESAFDQERVGLQTVQPQPCHGERSTQTAISNLTDALNNPHGAINSPAQVLKHQNQTLTSNDVGLSSTAGQHTVGGQAAMAVKANPESSTRPQQPETRNPSYPVIMTGAAPSGAVSGEAQDRPFVELANSQTVYEAPRLAMSPPQYQTAMQPPIKVLAESGQLPHCPGSEQYAMTFEDGLLELAQDLSSSQALQIPSGYHLVAIEIHQNNASGLQEATPKPLRSGAQESGIQLCGNENFEIIEAWHVQDDSSKLAQLPHHRSPSNSMNSAETKENSAPIVVSVQSDVTTVGRHPKSPAQRNPLTTANCSGDATVAYNLLEMPASTAVRVPLEAATATHNSVGIVKFGNPQQQVGTSSTQREGDCETPDEIRNFARAFKEWRLSLGLSETKVSRLLIGANGETYPANSIRRFENSGLCLEYANEIKLSLQEFMASFKPVPVQTSPIQLKGACETSDEIRNFARAFKSWRLSHRLGRLTVSRLLKGANGETYPVSAMRRFENSKMRPEYANEIKTALQKFMASYDPARVQTSPIPRMGDCETPDEIRNFARAFKEWRLSLGLSRTKVSRLLKEANGKTYSRTSILRFENLRLSLDFGNEIKLALQEFMASYDPVPVGTSLSQREGDCETSDEIRNFVRAFKVWRLSLRLGRLKVSRLLKGVNGETYSERSIISFEKLGLSVESANEIKLALQELMVSYDPVPVGTSRTLRISDCETSDEIKNFAAKFKEWRLSFGLSRTKVSHLLEGANGRTFTQSAVRRFESLEMCLGSANEIKLALQKLMALYEPVPVQTSSTPRVDDCETSDEIRNFAGTFKEWRLSLGLSRTKVSRLLEGAHGRTFTQSAVRRFESLEMCLGSANEIKLALQKFMASYKSVPDSGLRSGERK